MTPQKNRSHRCGFFVDEKKQIAYSTGFCDCTIFMAEVISADTSVMLLGTMRVVVASDATWL